MDQPLKEYRSYEEYEVAAKSFNATCGMVLFSFAKYECSKKDVILRNFVAKSSMSLQGVFALWRINNYQDCWVIYRSLLDRLLHLSYIGNNKQFEEFDDWSFFEQVKTQNGVKSNKEFKHEAAGAEYQLTSEQKVRIKHLSKNIPQWKRPKAKTMAKEMDMDFLYKFGYDMASMHVHPMANDGQQDFYTITKLSSSLQFPSQISVLNNSILISTMILQGVLNFSSFGWRKVLWDYIDEIRSFLDDGNQDYRLPFLKMSNNFLSETLCQPNST